MQSLMRRTLKSPMKSLRTKGAAETVGATPEQIRQYFGDEYIRNEFKKEKATKIVIESATEEAPAEEPAEKEAE